LIEVGEDVVDVFDADAEANHFRGHAGFLLLGRAHLPMRGGGGMASERFGVAEIDEAFEELEGVVEFFGSFKSALDAEGENRAGATVEIFLGELVVRGIGGAGVIDPGDASVVGEEFGDAAAIFHVTFDAERDGLDALQEQEGAERGKSGASGAEVNAAAARDVSSFLEMFHVNEAVIGGVRLVKHRETGGVFGPGKFAAVDYNPTKRRAVATKEFGQRVQNDVGTMINGAQEDRAGNGVIDDEGEAA